MTRIVVHTPRIAAMLLAGWLISSPSAGEEFSWQFAGSYREQRSAQRAAVEPVRARCDLLPVPGARRARAV